MSRKSSVIENTREQVLSSDINRIQKLDNREALNQLHDEARGDYWRSGIGEALQFSGQGPPKFILQRAPTWVPSGVDFTATIGEGEAYNTWAPPSPDDPNFRVARWAQTVVTFAAPDVTNARVDVVYALPGEQDTDPSIRTVLLDPVAGTTAPATVNKTRNPLATIAIAQGTPNASPNTTKGVPPPSAIALFEVIVAPAHTTSTNFSVLRALERPHYQVLAAAHGLIEGVLATTEGPADEGSGAHIFFDGASVINSSGLVRAILNGKHYSGFLGSSFGDAVGGGMNPVRQDAGAANPFAALVATHDVPYYMYLVPLTSNIGGTGNAQGSPFCVIESLTPPNDAGRPSAAIVGPTGTFQAEALYIGVGFKAKNTTQRKVFHWDSSDWVWAGSMGQNSTPSPQGLMAFNEDGDGGTTGLRSDPGANAGLNFVMATAPAIPHLEVSRRCKIRVAVRDSGDGVFQLRLGPFLDVRIIRNWGSQGATDRFIEDIVDVPHLNPFAEVSFFRGNQTTISFISIMAVAYKMGVHRLR